MCDEDAERRRAERNAKRRAHYLANTEQELARTKASYAANREKRLASAAAYRQANKEQRNASHRAYHLANQEERLAYMVAYHGGRVELRGFGAFAVKRRNARLGHNPRTGEAVSVPEKPMPFFKTGKQLRVRLNRKPTRPASAHPA